MDDLESKTLDELKQITLSLIEERNKLMATATPVAITLATEFYLRGNTSVIRALMVARESGDEQALKKAQIDAIRLRQDFNDALRLPSKTP